MALVSDSRLTQTLLPKVKTESAPENRALVYEALGNQHDVNPIDLGLLADSEQSQHARLRALKAWTEAACRQNTQLSLDLAYASRISELKEAALNHDDFAERRVALFSLAYVKNDPFARSAIDVISKESDSVKIRGLARGMLNSQP